ncbi:MAG: ABC transporter substrate-binding protein [Paracoccus sp. (in: a-proteobacteria)]|uniref:ABC transporter substrate-binding protein n=1 Tax=Paracoccus sp. TaxID=267 RepID=UPI0039E68C3F
MKLRLNALSCVIVAAALISGMSCRSEAQTIDEGAILKLGVLTRTSTLDPHASTLSTQPVHNSAWERLLRINTKGEVAPFLAREWAWSEDGSSLTLKLVEGASFNDGSPVTAAAVVASIERARTHKDSRVGSKFAEVESVVAEGDHIVRFNLSAGGADLLWTLADVAGSVINPACIEKDTDLTMAPAECTSSVMVLTEGTPNGIWKLRKSDRPYWDENAFRFAGIDFIPVGENEVVLNAMLTGDIDTAQLMGEGLARAETLINDGKLNGKPFTSEATRSLSLFLNPRVPPFDDSKLRHAVRAAIDPALLSQALFEGFCAPANQPLPAASWAANPQLEEVKSYDPEAVKRLLAEAGKPNGFEFTVFFQNTAAFNMAGQVIQAMLSDYGISMVLKPVQAGTVPEMIEGTASAVISTSSGTLSPFTLMDIYTNLGSRRAAVVKGSPIEGKVAALVDQANNPALSRKEQGAIWAEVWQAIYDEALTLTICQFREFWPTTLRLSSTEAGNQEGPIWAPGFEVRYLTIAGD